MITRLTHLLATLCLAGSLLSCHTTPLPTAEHPERWAEIERYIQASWPDFTEKNPEFPAPYLYGLNPGTLYYSDLYFHNEGLMRHGYWEIAKGNLDCMIYQIEQLGFIPNASGWGEDRSQTPCFSMSVRRYWELAPTKDSAWLRRAYRAVLTEYGFWTDTTTTAISDHSTPIAGLQRYSHHATDSALIEFYDKVLRRRFELPADAPAAEKIQVASHRMAEAENGMDFSPRFDGRCEEHIPVDLNSYLYGYEMDLALFERELGISDGDAWEERAKERAELINRYCWSEERGLYLDYDFVNKRHSQVASLSGWMPLHFGFATRSQARKVRESLPLFDSDGGLVVYEVTPQEIVYQWGDAAVWAPMQQIGIEAMQRYGFEREAKSIAIKWLNTVTRNYLSPIPATHRRFKYGDGTREPGFIYEKYTREGTINDYEYPCSIMLGWSASAFVVALETVEN